MRYTSRLSLLSHCILLSLTSFAVQARTTTPSVPCAGGDITQTCGLSVYTDNNFYQGSGDKDAVMAQATATNIYMDGNRSSGDTQSLIVNGTDMSGAYIQASKGGSVNITMTDGASADMIESGDAGQTTNTAITLDDAVLKGEDDSIAYTPGDAAGDKAYMMGSAIFIDPLDAGNHSVAITDGSLVQGSIVSAGAGVQMIALNNSTLVNGGIYTGSNASATTIALTNSVLDASQSEIAQQAGEIVSGLNEKGIGPFSNINVQEYDDVGIAVYGKSAMALSLNNSTLTGDIALLNEGSDAGPGSISVTMANNSTVNGDMTLVGQSSNTITLTDGSTLNGDVDAANNSGNTALTLDSYSRINGNIALGSGNDTVTLTHDSQVNGDVDAGAGDDTLSMDEGSTISGQISDFETVNTAGNNSINTDAINDTSTWNLQNGSQLIAQETGSNVQVNMSADSYVDLGTVTGTNDEIVVNSVTAASVNQQDQEIGTFTTAGDAPQTAAAAAFSNGEQQVESRSGAYNYSDSLAVVPTQAQSALLAASDTQSWDILFSSSRSSLASDVQGLIAGLDAAEQAGQLITDDIANHMTQIHLQNLRGHVVGGAQLWGDFLYQNGDVSDDVDYNSITQGAQGGVDWTMTLANGDSLTAGMALGWTRSRVEDNSGGENRFKDTVYGNYYSLYGGWQQALRDSRWGMFIDGSVSYGDMRYSLSAQNVTGNTSGMTEALSGSTRGDLYVAQARTGVNILLPAETVLQPYVTLGWDKAAADGYADSEIAFSDSHVSSWNSSVGVHLSTTVACLAKNTTLTPWLDMRYQGQFSDNTDIRAADYHNTDGHNLSLGILGAGISATIAHSVALNTGVYFGTGDVDNNASVQAGISYRF